MAETENQMTTPAARSMLRDFVGSISTMRGDLSNITAPPFVLDAQSTVEMPQYWSENPSIFCAPAHSDDPAERALLVLRWFLSSLRNQNYMGHSEDHGVKKPLNAFLGEAFLAKWEDAMGTTRLVSEQVSHHPPITACRVWNDEHGVEASGYTRQTITFSGAVTIKQTGHALFNLSKHNESYLIPLPELKVRGLISGTLYPELDGKYYLPSTSGYTSVIDFSGKGWFGTGRKHSLEAKVFKEEDGENNPIYTVKGTWNREFITHDVRTGEDIENFNVLEQKTKATPLTVEPLSEQDPWESRRAWKDVISALNRGDMKGTVEAKSKLEQGQREMRKHEKQTNIDFQLRFFKTLSEHEKNPAEKLTRLIPGTNTASLATERNETKGVWTFDHDSWTSGQITRPYHNELHPDNSHSIPLIATNDEPISESKRSSVSSTASVPSLASNISHSPSRSASPISPRTSLSRETSISTSKPDSNPISISAPNPKRRSIDSFRFPFRSSNRRSIDLSKPTTASHSSSPSHPHLHPHSPAPKAPNQTAISSKTVHADLIIAPSQPSKPPQNPTQNKHEHESKPRSQSLDMSLQEQNDIETMLRNKYSSFNSRRGEGAGRKSRLSVCEVTT